MAKQKLKNLWRKRRMKEILREWRNFLNEQQTPIEIEREDGRATYRTQDGYITVVENSPWANGAHSIYGFYVDEDKRGQGIGKQLVRVVMDAYPGEEISAQVSSLSSLKVFLDLGFRVPEEPDASFDRAKELFDQDYGSLNLRLNDFS
jgi:GNAT superfamily N-acetyltransferase